MELGNRWWVPIAFAAILSEAVPMSSLIQLPESLRQMNANLNEHSLRGVFVLTVAYFPLFTALVVLAAFCAYLAVTRTFSLWGFLCGLPTALFVLFLGYISVIALLVFSSVPQLIFYYLILRLPMFLSLVLALWIAQARSVRLGPLRFARLA